MRPLDASLGRLHQTLGLARPDTVRLLEQHWPSVIGADLAPKCHVESIRHGELVVAVDDAALAEHLRWSARDLVAAVNSVCGGAVVEHLVVKVGRRPS